MLNKLYSLDKAKAIVPFVRLSYGKPTEYMWSDEEGNDHIIHQAEGGEQGDPLMPLLFALGIHNALEAVSLQLEPGEDICAFLDDVYVICKPERVRPIYDLLAAHLYDSAGIQLHTGRISVWNSAGICPPDIQDLGGDEGAWSPRGIKILGVQIGSDEFMREHAEDRLNIERRFLVKIERMADPQCA